MTLYVDASALLKRYISEPDSSAAEELLTSDQELATARHTAIEVRRALPKHLSGNALVTARRRFLEDWKTVTVIDLSEAVCGSAATLAETTGVRTLDALHLGAAEQAGGGGFQFLTYDVRLAQVARSLGWTVLGV